MKSRFLISLADSSCLVDSLAGSLSDGATTIVKSGAGADLPIRMARTATIQI